MNSHGGGALRPDQLTGGEKETDKSLPHDSALRVLHDATQASATHTIVLGDKEHVEVTEIYNVDCVVDLAEAPNEARWRRPLPRDEGVQ
jgi:hypothetical protein